MNFKGLGLRATASFALCALLASCGGGDIIEPFAPTRIIAFGDESSYIGASGTEKYTINGAACANNPIWLQTVASYYGLALPGCLGTATRTTSEIRAVAGAKVAGLAGQASGVSWNATTLATVMVGSHDIQELFAAYLADRSSASVQLAQAKTRGSVVAAQVNAIAAAGGRVLVLTTPNLAITPYGVQVTDPTDKAVLTQLSRDFNLAIRNNIISDGYKVGLVKPDELFQQLINANATFVDYTHAACATALPNCTLSTLSTAASTSSAWTAWLWAGNVQPSPAGHAQIGAAAVNLLARMPF